MAAPAARMTALRTGIIGSELVLGHETAADGLQYTFFGTPVRLAGQQELLDPQDKADWCLVSVGIEHFELFVDWYGRQTGDLLIERIGKLLQEAQQNSGGIAGYLGKDEFILLAPFELPRVKRLYAHVLDLTRSIGSSVGFLPAFGISLVKGCMDVLTLHKQANAAIRYAREHLNTRICIFEPSMQEQTDKEYQILFNFQEGLKNGELFFCLQPQCLAANGKIVGAESLARWRRADGTMVSPAEFVPVLEKYGFVTDLDKFIWEEVCVWLKGWISQGHTPLPISVNVSQVDLYSLDVADYFDRLLQKHGLPKDMLKIEITESAYVGDFELVRDTVQRLRDNGFLVLMDDFGSGYSSLNMLSNLNVDILKLDAHFLHTDDTRNEKGLHILESIVNMAKTLALPIIVEGVESREQRDFLQNLGCRYVQGYFFYRPMTVADFEKLITVRANIDLRGFIFIANEQFRLREFLDQTVYSDSMLNSILGPVAIYRLRGRDVDIVRFNEQFHKSVNIQNFQKRLLSIQNYMPQNEREELYAALARAEKDRYNGASCTLTFFRPDGTPMRFLIRFYFLGAEESGKKFYGSARDVTEFDRMKNQLELLSEQLPQTVIVRRTADAPERYNVVLNGLGSLLGISETALLAELRSGSFFLRVEEGERARLRQLIAAPGEQEQPPDCSFRLRGADGAPVLLILTVKHVQNLSKQLESLLILRKA